MESKSLSFETSDELSGLRLDKAISEQYEEISRSRIAGIIKEDELRADYVLPDVFDERVAKEVAKAVSEASK